MFRKYWYFAAGSSAGAANTTLAVAAVVVEEENRHDEWKNEKQMEDAMGVGVLSSELCLNPGC